MKDGDGIKHVPGQDVVKLTSDIRSGGDVKANTDKTPSEHQQHQQRGDSLQQTYQMWLKEKEKGEQQNRDSNPGSNGDNGDFRVDTVLERGPSPPETDNASSYDWSYEEQFKQLYEIDNDPERKNFLDEYFEFMKSRNTPVSRIPIMAKQILDLYQLYNLVVKHGGLVQVIRNKQWSKITKGLNLPTSITSAAFTLRTQYLKYLYAYECTMHNFSTPKELQAAIDSNRRDRFSTFYHNSSEARDYPYPVSDYPPRHLHPHLGFSSAHPLGELGARGYSAMKRQGENLKYMESSPKVFVLPDGTPSLAERKSPPLYPSRSPREADMRTMVHHDHHRARGRVYSKDWDGDARHMFEEEARGRSMMGPRPNPPVCNDKNCNGVECQYARPPTNSYHHQGHTSHNPVSCACSNCKYPPRSQSLSSSPNHNAPPPHHVPAKTENGLSNNNLNVATNGNSTINNTSDENLVDTTLKIKLPDWRRGGASIRISLEVSGVTYEGVISATQTPPTPISSLDTGSESNESETNRV